MFRISKSERLIQQILNHLLIHAEPIVVYCATEQNAQFLTRKLKRVLKDINLLSKVNIKTI